MTIKGIYILEVINKGKTGIKMDIQSVILEQGRRVRKSLLYRMDQKAAVTYLPQGIQINSSHRVSFDTYYNAFSTGKWKKYTSISSVGLRVRFIGEAVIEVFHSRDGRERIAKKRFCVNTPTVTEKILEVGELPNQGVLYFTIEARGTFCLYEAAWCSESSKVNDSIKLGLAICTYKKEDWVMENSNIINHSLEEGKLKLFSEKVRILIADNGKTLKKKQVTNEYVKVIPNKNCGGVGGFTRCILEFLKCNDAGKDKISHVVLMDDDVIIEPEVIIRTIVFLMYLKKKYTSYSLCGAMLYQENMSIQHSSGEAWRNGVGIRLKANYNLENFEKVVLNEKEEKIDYAGWFYCVMPIAEIDNHGLPLPIFIHCDDIEYGLRMQGKFITLNGINIWHPDHRMKHTIYMRYYDTRNRLIVNAIHENRCINTRRYIISLLCREFIKDILRYDYIDLALTMQGVMDFCYGIDWLEKTDAEKRHRELLIDVDQLNPVISVLDSVKFGYKKEYLVDFLPQNVTQTKLGKNRKWDYIKAVTNWIMPIVKKKSILWKDFMNIRYFVGTNKVIVLDNDTGQGRLYEKDYRKLLQSVVILCRTLSMVFTRYPSCVTEYRGRISETSTVKFWERYLGLAECEENES
ncbi:MAG: glycosyltransferase [bacterium]|nr:glycosyltransferase [bacterium]